MCGLPLPPLEAESRAATNFYRVFVVVVALFLAFKLTCTTRFVMYGGFMEKMIAETVEMLVSTGLALSLVYWSNLDRMSELMSATDALSREMQASGLGPEAAYSQLYLEDSRLISRLNRVICPSMSLSPVVFCLSVPVVDYFRGDYRRRFPVPAHCPFERKLPVLYEISVLFLILTSLFPALQRIGNEFICIGFFRVQIANYKYLSAAIRAIGQKINKEFPEETSKKLVKWIRLHQKVLRNVADFQNILSPIVIVYYLSMIGIVACGLFYQLNAQIPDVGQSLSLAFFLVISLTQFYLLCHMADELSVEADKMTKELYCIPWYKLQLRDRAYLRFIINIANKAVSMKAYKAPSFSISKEAFVGFLLNIGSAYMGFKNIKNLD